MAYSDVISISLHLADHALPYFHTRVEYPGLTGIFIGLAAWALGVRGYFLASSIGLLACSLGTLYFVYRIDRRFAWTFSFCPLLLVYGLLNWDPLAIHSGWRTTPSGALRSRDVSRSAVHGHSPGRWPAAEVGTRWASVDRVVDRRWDPPVTLGIRLVSVIADDLQHTGQAAYARGLLAT